MILFAGVLLVSNIVIFTMSQVQYEREIARQQTGFEEMMVHLITMEDIDTAITYIEHFNHTQGIDIAFYDPDGILLYETSDQVDMSDPLVLTDGDGLILGTIYYDDQDSFLGTELTLGLIMMNGFSILIFLLFLKLLYSYLNSWYGLMQKDFAKAGMEDEGFQFKDIETVSRRLKQSLDTEKRLKEYQKEYVKMLAHDIKTPLTVIKAYLEGVKLNRIEMNDEIMDDLLMEVDEIEHMIPRFMNDNIESTPTRQNIKEVIQNIINRLSEVFQTRGISVKSKLDDYELTISYLDISRIVEHLLFNAFYYNKQNGLIEITLDSTNKKLIVRDTGIGMDKETLDKVKSGNYRALKAQELNRKGSGFGLQIVFEIVTRLGFDMDIQSEIDSGTTVTISLK